MNTALHQPLARHLAASTILAALFGCGVPDPSVDASKSSTDAVVEEPGEPSDPSSTSAFDLDRLDYDFDHTPIVCGEHQRAPYSVCDVIGAPNIDQEWMIIEIDEVDYQHRSCDERGQFGPNSFTTIRHRTLYDFETRADSGDELDELVAVRFSFEKTLEPGSVLIVGYRTVDDTRFVSSTLHLRRQLAAQRTNASESMCECDLPTSAEELADALDTHLADFESLCPQHAALTALDDTTLRELLSDDSRCTD